jgi:hypothetical protein
MFPDLVCEIRILDGLQAAVVERLILPEESRAIYELRAGTKSAISIERQVKWHVSDEERPILATCPVCHGTKSVTCRSCKGSGKFRNKKGAMRPCSCGSGKRDCPYCKSTGSISCRILDKGGNKLVSLPSKHRDFEGYRYKVGSSAISSGVSPLIRDALQLARRESEERSQDEELSSNDHSAKDKQDVLSVAESSFAAKLAEMRELLRIELDCELVNQSCAKLVNGQALKLDKSAKDRLSSESILVKFDIDSAWPKDWQAGSALLFYGATAAAPRKTYVHELEDKVVTLLFREKRTKIKLSRSGQLLPREAGRLVKVQLDALSYWENADSLEHQLKRSIALPSPKKLKTIPRIDNFFNKNIEANKSQRTAVETVVSEAYPLVCIQGPPGTGKTSVICEIVRQELKKNSARVLISSQSNLAVDNVLERLYDESVLKPLRIGNAPKIISSLHKLLPEVWTAPKPGFLRSLRKLFSKEKPHSGDKSLPLRERYDEAKVIGATCIGSEHPIVRAFSNESGLNKNGFSLVVIDEGARSTPMETLVPMQRAQRCVLVGDHKQLPPVITADVRSRWLQLHPDRSIEDSPAAISLFEQVLDKLPPSARAVLSTQFRMHPEIASFVSEVFYSDENLTSGAGTEERSLPLPQMPIALSYHPTSSYGVERFDRKEGTSRVNLAEARSVEKILSFLDRHSTAPIEVGIITFYKAQVALIQNQLKNRRYQHVNFDSLDAIATLDSFQGKEKDIIILSLVRSPQGVEYADAEWYRFFLDIRRLNVALSRAKRRLFIIGDIERILQIQKNRETLDGFTVLERLHQYILEHDCLVPELPLVTPQIDRSPPSKQR